MLPERPSSPYSAILPMHPLASLVEALRPSGGPAAGPHLRIHRVHQLQDLRAHFLHISSQDALRSLVAAVAGCRGKAGGAQGAEAAAHAQLCGGGAGRPAHGARAYGRLVQLWSGHSCRQGQINGNASCARVRAPTCRQQPSRLVQIQRPERCLKWTPGLQPPLHHSMPDRSVCEGSRGTGQQVDGRWQGCGGGSRAAPRWGPVSSLQAIVSNELTCGQHPPQHSCRSGPHGSVGPEQLSTCAVRGQLSLRRSPHCWRTSARPGLWLRQLAPPPLLS